MKPKDEPAFIQRSRLDIIASLLSRSSEGSRKTRLIYGCNLSVSQFNKYTNYLIESGLLKKHIEGRNVEIYTITDKGSEFLVDYDKIKRVLDKIQE